MISKVRINRSAILVLLIVLLAGSLGVVWFLANFERKTREIRSGYSPAALQNPLLAATRYLQAIGMEAQSHRGRDLLVNLPPAGDALVVYRQTGSLSPSRLDDLYSWIDSGGHLIIVPKRSLKENEEPYEDDITSLVGARLRYRDDNCGCDEKNDSVVDGQPADKTGDTPEKLKDEEPAENEENDDASDQQRISVELDGTEVSLSFSDYLYLEEAGKGAALRIGPEEKEGAYLLQYRLGSGKLTVLADSSVFNNRQINESDHGWLLSWLVKENNKTWLLYSSNMDGLFTLLGRNMPRFLVSLAGLILFMLWAWQHRIGPLQEPAQNIRRNILAHIDALGRFNWEFDRAASLVAQTRESALQYWVSRLPGNGENGVATAVVAQKTGLNKSDVENGFYREVVTEQDLIVVSRCLQKLRQGDKHDS